MQGIYKIQNLINNKIYIGSSKHIEIRWLAHKNANNWTSKNKTCPKLYNAFLKYGIQNFQFTTLEIVQDPQKLIERENYWIGYYDSINTGYNCIWANSLAETNPHAKLNWDQVHEIKDILINSSITINEIADYYHVHISQIYRINRGESWREDNEYPLRKWNLEARNGQQNGRGTFTDEEVLNIRQRYVKETVDQIYIDYKDKCSLSGFKKIVQGATYKHLPIYKKTTHTWIQPSDL